MNRQQIDKKKRFQIDNISEESFYGNLLLGLPSFLKDSPIVNHLKLKHLSSTNVQTIHKWEQSNSTILPADLRNFYLSTNGFSFTYNVKLNSEEPELLGGIQISPIEEFTRLPNNEVSYLKDGQLQFLDSSTRVFVLSKLDDWNYVVMAKFKPFLLNYWLYRKGCSFSFLCNDFTTYFRMAVGHLGIPGWQFLIAGVMKPEWTMEIFQILAPGRVATEKFEEFKDCSDFINDVIDPSVFQHEDDSSEEVIRPQCSAETSKKVARPRSKK